MCVKAAQKNMHDAAMVTAAMLNSRGWGSIVIPGEEISLGKAVEMLSESVNPSFSVRGEDEGENIRISFYGSETPYSIEGEYWTMEDGRRVMMTSEEIALSHAERGYSLSWEKESTGEKTDALDPKTFSLFLKSVRNADPVHLKSGKRESVLRSFSLYGETGMNNASHVLFSRNPEVYLLVRDKVLGERRYRGNIFVLLEKAYRVLEAHLTEAERADRYIIFEIIVNAFAHAWYGEEETVIELNVTDDFIVIYNPGTFPRDLRPVDYVAGDGRGRIRNPLIMNVLHAAGYVHNEAKGFRSLENLSSGIRFDCETDDWGFRVIFTRRRREWRTQKMSGGNGMFTFRYA